MTSDYASRVHRAIALFSSVFLLACRSAPNEQPATSTSTNRSAPSAEPIVAASTTPSASVASSASIAAAKPIGVVPSPLVAARPFRLHVPAGYDATKPAPLLVLFHGYGSDAAEFERFLRPNALADTKGLFVAIPDGTRDGSGKRFWNATDACCNFGHVNVDDVAYLSAILDDVEARYAIDPDRVFLAGHSNGGYFSHRAACDLSHRVAAVASIAGMLWKDTSKCAPTHAVSVAQIHGDADGVVHIGGGHLRDDPGRPEYPSARETVEAWAKKDGCATTFEPLENKLDLDPTLPGAETSITRATSCPSGVGVELWTVHGEGHVPSASGAWMESIWSFFEAHPRAK